jgi:hypothetical protein
VTNVRTPSIVELTFRVWVRASSSVTIVQKFSQNAGFSSKHEVDLRVELRQILDVYILFGHSIGHATEIQQQITQFFGNS